MVIAIICLPITAIVVGLLVLKSVQLGLKWQVQVKENKAPTLDINVIKPIKQAITKPVEQTYTAEQMKEWNPFQGG